MAPKYELFSGFTIDDALDKAGAPQYETEFHHGEPPVEFFNQPPENSAGVFSTVCGTRPFRMVQNPTYQREGYYWWAAEIQRVCDELRRNLPQVCRNVEALETFWDLYKYFDAYDIYHRGAQNLWNVIHTLLYENQYANAIVDGEQRQQAEERMPLFESLAAEVLKNPEMQAKLLAWDKNEQQDIIKVFTSHDLQVFEGYEHYHEHYLDAIRNIFRRQYETIRQRFPVALDPPVVESQVSTTRQGRNIPLSQLFDGGHHKRITETLDDPFMDKFEIPNRIIGGILIVNGTSRTAALKARQDDAASPTGNTARRADTNSSPMGDNRDNTTLPNTAATDYTVSETARCSSAPSIGGDPTGILGNLPANEARVYPGGSHEVDKKLLGCEKPDAPKDANSYTPGTVIETQMPGPELNMQQQPSTTNQALSLVRGHRSSSQYNNRRPSSVWPPMPPFASNGAPILMPSSHLPQTRGRGMSQGAFANQIPIYVPPRQIMQPLHPPTMQKMQRVPSAYTQSNEGRHTTNTVIPHYQTVVGSQHNMAPVLADGSRGSRPQKTSFGSGYHGGGKWQHAGADDIHGPKVVFRRDSTHDREGQNHRASQWQGQELTELGRRTSTVSAHDGHRRFSNNLPHSYINPAGPTATGGDSRESTATERPCVNSDRGVSVYIKFDACNCQKCYDRDRSIFIGRLKQSVVRSNFVEERLRQHFGQYGEIESVRSGFQNSAHVVFYSFTSAVAAVNAGKSVHIDGLDSLPLRVNHVAGSRFFSPIPRPRTSGHGLNTQGHFAQNNSRNLRMVIAPPSLQGPNNLNYTERPPMLYRGSSLGGPADPPSTMSFAVNPSEFNSKTTTPTQFRAGRTETIRSPQSGVYYPPIDTKQSPPQHGSKRDEASPEGTTQYLARSTTELTHDMGQMAASRSPSHHDTPSTVVQMNETPSNDVNVDPAQVSEHRGLGHSDEEISVDYGTVRIRRGGTKNKAILSDWYEPQGCQTLSGQRQVSDTDATAQINQPLASVNESSQQMSTAQYEGGITAESQLETGESKLPPDHERPNKLHDTNPQHKINEVRGNYKTCSQPSSEEKLAKVHSSEFLPQPEASQAENQQHGEPANHSQLQLATPRLPSPAHVHVPLTRSATSYSQSYENEPFPPYRDLMSGPQLPLGGRKGHATRSGRNKSISSTASTNTLGRKGQETEGVTPSLTVASPTDPDLMPSSLAPTYKRGEAGSHYNTRGQTHDQANKKNTGPKKSAQVPHIKEKNVDESKKAKSSNSTGSGENFPPKDANGDSNGGDPSSSAKQSNGRGKGKSHKNAKQGRNGQKSTESGKLTNKGCNVPVDLKENDKQQQPTTLDKKDKSPKQDRPKDVKTDKQENENGKEKDVAIPKTSVDKDITPAKTEVEVTDKTHDRTKDTKADQQGNGKEKAVAVPQKSPTLKDITPDKTLAKHADKNQDHSKDVQTDQQEKSKGKMVAIPKKTPATKDVTPAKTAAKDTDGKHDHPKDVKANQQSNGKGNAVAVSKKASVAKDIKPAKSDSKDVDNKHDHPEDVKTDNQGSFKGKAVPIPEKTPVAKDTTPAKTEPKDTDNKTAKSTLEHSSPRTDIGTPSSTSSGATTSSKSKHRKAKNRKVSKKPDAGAQPTAKASGSDNVTGTAVKAPDNIKELSPPRQPQAQEAVKDQKPAPKPNDSPALPSSPVPRPVPAPRAKPVPALAPIPLYDKVPSVWRRVGSGRSPNNDPVAGSNEKTPPSGERKGG